MISDSQPESQSSHPRIATTDATTIPTAPSAAPAIPVAPMSGLRKLFHHSRHKVVAYPNAEQRLRLQQTSVLSAKSSDAALGEGIPHNNNHNNISTSNHNGGGSNNNNNSYTGGNHPLRPRSLSAGRTATRRPRADLIQDVYDRLGVQRGAWMMTAAANDAAPLSPPKRSNSNSNIESLSSPERGRSRGAVAGHSPSATGSGLPTSGAEPLRARSLSRDGRLRSVWPPSTSFTGSEHQLPTTGTSSSAKPSSSNSDRIFRNTPAPSAADQRSVLLSPSRRVALPIGADEISSPKPQHYRSSGSGSFTESAESPRARSYRTTAAAALTAAAVHPSHNNNRIHTSKSHEWRDEKKESDLVSGTDSDELALVNSPSIKDRMRVFTAPVPTKPAATNKKLDDTPQPQYPPLIDIYADEKNHEAFDAPVDNVVADLDTTTDKNKNNNSSENHQLKASADKKETSTTRQANDKSLSSGNKTATTLANDKSLSSGNKTATTLANDKSLSSGNKTATTLANDKSLSSGNKTATTLANSYLGAIQTSPSKQNSIRRIITGAVPFEEVSGGDDQGSVSDSVAVSMLSSSASDDQCSPTNRSKLTLPSIYNNNSASSAKKSSPWLENSRSKRPQQQQQLTTSPTQQSRNFPNQIGNTTSDYQAMQQALSATNIEKMVDERVKVRLFELERRVEDQMRYYLKQMDEKVKARMAEWEHNGS